MLSEGSNKTLIRHYSGLIQALLRRYDIYFFFMLDYEQHSQQNYILYNQRFFTYLSMAQFCALEFTYLSVAF